MASPTATESNGLKRRRSEEVEQESKRQRQSPSKTPPPTTGQDEKEKGASPNEGTAAASATESGNQPRDPPERRRKSGVVDEKKRSKRLFGALLGNLNQPSNRESKRRLEIEERRKAELQRQDDERLEDKQKRLERLAEQRLKVQEKVDEQNMRMRHKALLDTANFLRTTAEPKLYYRPWDLRPDEEDRIDDQLKEAQDQIDKELAEVNGGSPPASKPEDATSDDHSLEDHEAPHDSPQPAPNTETKSEAEQATVVTPEEAGQDMSAKSETTDPQDNSVEGLASLAPDTDQATVDLGTDAAHTAPIADPNEQPKMNDIDEGDHVVEGEEDTLAY